MARSLEAITRDLKLRAGRIACREDVEVLEWGMEEGRRPWKKDRLPDDIRDLYTILGSFRFRWRFQDSDDPWDGSIYLPGTRRTDWVEEMRDFPFEEGLEYRIFDRPCDEEITFVGHKEGKKKITEPIYMTLTDGKKKHREFKGITRYLERAIKRGFSYHWVKAPPKRSKEALKRLDKEVDRRETYAITVEAMDRLAWGEWRERAFTDYKTSILRRFADALGLEGCEDMAEEELLAAVIEETNDPDNLTPETARALGRAGHIRKPTRAKIVERLRIGEPTEVVELKLRADVIGGAPSQRAPLFWLRTLRDAEGGEAIEEIFEEDEEREDFLFNPDGPDIGRNVLLHYEPDIPSRKSYSKATLHLNASHVPKGVEEGATWNSTALPLPYEE